MKRDESRKENMEKCLCAKCGLLVNGEPCERFAEYCVSMNCADCGSVKIECKNFTVENEKVTGGGERYG